MTLSGSVAVSETALQRLDAALTDTSASFERLRKSHDLMMQVAEYVSAVPSWAKIGPIATFLQTAEFLDLQYQKIRESAEWYSRLPEWTAQGLISIRPSTTTPGDIDAVILDPVRVPVPPFAREVSTLGNWYVALGLVGGLVGLKLTTDYLETQEVTQRKQIDYLILKEITSARAAGEITESTAVKLADTVKAWKQTATDSEEDTFTQITSLLKWGVLIALGIGGVSLILRLRDEWRGNA